MRAFIVFEQLMFQLKKYLTSEIVTQNRLLNINNKFIINNLFVKHFS
jgi:hypothetical protein